MQQSVFIREDSGSNDSVIYVSCTTTNDRLELLYYTFLSLKKQTFDGFVFCVNISKDPYLNDDGIKDIPEWLSGAKNTEINWVPNTGSYRKLLPKLNEIGEEDVIVTCDDDILYGEKWLESLLAEAEKRPGHVVCSRARRVRKNLFRKPANYHDWSVCYDPEEGLDIVPVGCGGVLYRRKLFHSDILNDDGFRSVAPTSDDLWFKAATLARKTPVYVDPRIDALNIHLLHNRGLYTETNSLFTPGKRKSLVKLGLLYVLQKAMGLIGIGMSSNDRAWKGIVRHLKKNFGVDLYRELA